jgi:hypothetical protein
LFLKVACGSLRLPRFYRRKNSVHEKENLSFLRQYEAETGPWKKEIGEEGAACPKISSTADRLEAKCFSSRQRT